MEDPAFDGVVDTGVDSGLSANIPGSVGVGDTVVEAVPQLSPLQPTDVPPLQPNVQLQPPPLPATDDFEVDEGGESTFESAEDEPGGAETKPETPSRKRRPISSVIPRGPRPRKEKPSSLVCFSSLITLVIHSSFRRSL